MDTDRNLLFGILALQLELVDSTQFTEACAAWAVAKQKTLAEMLVERGWLTPNEADEVEELVERKIVERASDADKSSMLEATREMPAPSNDSAPLEPTLDGSNLPRDARLLEDTQASTSPALSAPRSYEQMETIQYDASEEGAQKPHDVRRMEDTLPSSLSAPSGYDQMETMQYSAVEERTRYSLTKLHGEGGIGRVWQAHDQRLNRQVALKEIRPDREASVAATKRFAKEAQITSQLEHPNIVPVYELSGDPTSSRCFYTMRFVRGDTFRSAIDVYHRHRREGKATALELRELLSSFIAICNALGYAHSRGVLHRDLKPSNVMVGSFGEVVVLDWGLAKMIGQPDDDDEPLLAGGPISITDDVAIDATLQGAVLGTLPYMAPEQAAGRIDKIDARTDIYGLGAILFAILTGNHPHRGTSTQEVRSQILNEPTPRVLSDDAKIHPGLDAICAKAMAKKRSERYAKARDLAEDIRRWLADEPVECYREPMAIRAGRWLRRHRTWTQSIAAALVLVSIVSAVAVLLVDQARRDEQRARAKTQLALDAEQKALAETRLAKDEATRRFRQARRAVDESFTGISDGLLNYPGVQDLRTQLLRDASEHYRGFTQERSDDPELRIEFALALLRLGDVHRLLAKFDESKQSYEQALAVFNEMLRDDLTNQEARFALAQCQNHLGLLHVTVGTIPDGINGESSYQLAERAYKSASESCELLLKDDSQRLDYRRLAAQVCANRGVLFSRTSRDEEAIEAFARAQEDFAQLTAETGADADREELAKSGISLGELLTQIGRGDEAEKELKRAIRGYEVLVENDANQPRYLQGLADARLTLANAVHALGRSSESAVLYQAAIDDYVALITSRPDVPAYRDHLATAEINLAQVLSRLGRNPDAQEHAELGLRFATDLVNADSKVVEYFVKEVYAILTLGQVLRDLDDLTLAETAFLTGLERTQALIDYSQEDSLYHRLRGQCYNGLGITQLLSDARETAQQSFMNARIAFDKAIQLAPNDEFSHDGLAWANLYLGDTLRLLERTDEAAGFYRFALQGREAWQLNAEHRYRLAWLLVHCRDASIRDMGKALDMASKLSLEQPTRSDFLELQAVAWYRQENWEQCLNYLDQAELVRISLKSPLDFWRAMVLWQQGKQGPAKASFDRAVARMDKNAPGDWHLRTVREEAKALLGNGAATDESAAE